VSRGTESSNPASSSGVSTANSTHGATIWSRRSHPRAGGVLIGSIPQRVSAALDTGAAEGAPPVSSYCVERLLGSLLALQGF
jgi:hypothetical protein